MISKRITEAGVDAFLDEVPEGLLSILPPLSEASLELPHNFMALEYGVVLFSDTVDEWSIKDYEPDIESVTLTKRIKVSCQCIPHVIDVWYDVEVSLWRMQEKAVMEVSINSPYVSKWLKSLQSLCRFWFDENGVFENMEFGEARKEG
jgi:hypothetical protein